ncbi:hypothetical protein ASU32_19440 [Tsukamurella tyrosinosolvens]|nr:hypothetical protein ASU32_19440 [Tsukamurella tyrosinosolvens]
MHRLGHEPMVFACRPDHRLADRGHVNITELVDDHLIGLPPHYSLRRLVDDAFATAGVHAHTPHEFALDYTIAAQLIHHGLGTALMPASEAVRFPHLRALEVRPRIT